MSDNESDARGQIVAMIDPAWEPSEEGQQPPIEAILGGWRIPDEGEHAPVRFEPNPQYLPSKPDSPTDPADAGLQLIVRGEADGDQFLALLNDAMLGLAADESGKAVISQSPDGIPSVLVTTAPAHRDRVDVPGWVDGVTLPELADALPDEGVDVLINPGAPYSMRVLTTAIKEYLANQTAEAGQSDDRKSEADNQD